MQFSPVVSVRGLTDVGIEMAHCHHSALNFLKSLLSANATLIDIMNPKQTPANATKRPKLPFMTCSLVNGWVRHPAFLTQTGRSSAVESKLSLAPLSRRSSHM